MEASHPPDVVIEIAPAGEFLRQPRAGDLVICPSPTRLAGARVALARQVYLEGPAALPQGASPIRRILLPPGPSLDDLLAAYLVLTLVTADADGPASAVLPQAERLCNYAAQLREGLLPGSVAPERSLAGVYLALLELNRDQPRALVLGGVRLLQVALSALHTGQSLLQHDLFSTDEHFVRERTYLEQDRQRYARDRDAGPSWQVRVGHLRGHLLCLRQPTSILFRLFVHRDPQAPAGYGFDLVLVERPGAKGRLHVALFADPTRRLHLGGILGPLCQRLDRLERAVGVSEEPWYDGRLHHYHRLASPRQGSAIPPPRLQRVIRAALGATKVRSVSRAFGKRLALGAGAGAVLVAVGLHVTGLWGLWGPRQAGPVVARGDWQQHRLPSGPPVSGPEREGLLGGKVRNYALLVAASDYAPRSRGGLGPLRTPWRDACALRERLVRRFGYERRNVLTLSDSPCLRDTAGPPSRERILWTLEHLPIRSDDSLLFYYAGHGAIEDEPGGRYGYLQPGGWEAANVSREDRGLRMRTLAELLRDKVAARHQLLLIDACHSGETAIVRGGDEGALDRLDAPVRAGWRERPVYAVITATRSVELALEERLIDSPYPHSLFARALLEGLSYAPREGRGPQGSRTQCRLRADTDPAQPDGFVTDGELFKFVARRLPELRAPLEVPGLPAEAQSQEPEWNPWSAWPRPGDGARRIGEFMLVPRDAPPARCDGEPEPEPDACRPELCAPVGVGG